MRTLKIPIEVSDEDYAKILKYHEQEKNNSSEDIVATIFIILGILIFIGGFIAGIVLGRVPDELFTSHYEFSFTVALTYWLVSFITGMLFIGFGKIIQSLTDIKNK